MKIKIEYQEQIIELNIEADDPSERKTIFEILREHDIWIPSFCAGNGTCGKCIVRCFEANELTDQEKLFFTPEEIEQGFRLACELYPIEGSRIQIIQKESEYDIITDFADGRLMSKKSSQNMKSNVNEKKYSIAIDIGTTTLAGILFSNSTDFVLASESSMNGQRTYGSDVISRIQASNAGKGEELQECIRKDLQKIIYNLVKTTQIDKKDVKQIALAGNTTMIHLLMGYSCEKLGRYPFMPVNLKPIHGTCKELLSLTDLESDVYILPGISAFVGGDITAGLLMTEFHKSNQMNLLIDLGTNGEMAVGSSKWIKVASAAAGPAFEGGNITFGTGSMLGAVSHANWIRQEMMLETIGNQLPITGICGTGALELLSELLNAGIVDQTGLMDNCYFKEGYPLGIGKSGEEIRFMQKDVRELQLAKAAIRAGIETLLEMASLTYNNIDTIFLAGGFGYQLDVNKAIRIGLLPKNFRGKIKAVGNSSLYGAAIYANHKEKRKQAEELAASSEELVLAKSEAFQKHYLKSMCFE